MADIFEVMMRHVENHMAGRYTERHGLVTSYDPKNYLAKVTYMPEGTESGWLPIETGHIGNGYGITMGLQPGNGGNSQGSTGNQDASDSSSQSSSQMGDQVVIRAQEGDFENFKIVSRVHSSEDMPPQTQSGEIRMWTVFKKDSDAGQDSAQSGQSGSTGQQLFLKNDGSFNATDGGGAIVVMDGQGNYTLTAV